MRIVRWLLHAEGGFVGAGAVWAYATQTDASWLLFVLLWLVPDIGLVGLLKNTRVGSLTYNPLHSYIGPVVLVVLGIGLGADVALAVGLIWASHVGVDRAVGYGLKSTWSAQQTHLQQLTDPQNEADFVGDAAPAAREPAVADEPEAVDDGEDQDEAADDLDAADDLEETGTGEETGDLEETDEGEAGDEVEAVDEDEGEAGDGDEESEREG